MNERNVIFICEFKNKTKEDYTNERIVKLIIHVNSLVPKDENSERTKYQIDMRVQNVWKERNVKYIIHVKLKMSEKRTKLNERNLNFIIHVNSKCPEEKKLIVNEQNVKLICQFKMSGRNELSNP